MPNRTQPLLPTRYMSRAFAIFAALVGLNMVLVGWSVLQKHLWASPQSTSKVDIGHEESESDAVNASRLISGEPSKIGPSESSTADTRPLTAQERLQQLPPPAIDSGTATDSPPPDDPLFDEILKQAANQFPELSAPTDLLPLADPIKNGAQQLTETQSQQPTAGLPPSVNSRFTHSASSPAAIELVLVQNKLETLGQLNLAALRLIQMADQQRELGRQESAHRSMQQCEQIQALMRDLLQ